MGNSDFSWFIDGSYLKDDNGKYHAGYALTTPLAAVKTAFLPMATLAQQAQLHTFTQACTLAKDKTANICTDSRYAFRIAHDFGMLWKQHKAAKSVYLTCPTCQKYNPGMTVCTVSRHVQLPNGPFKVWQMDFIQLPLSYGYKHISVMVCMLSH